MPGDGIAGKGGESNSSRHPSGGGGVRITSPGCRCFLDGWRVSVVIHCTRARRRCPLLDDGGGLSSVVVAFGSRRRAAFLSGGQTAADHRGGGYRRPRASEYMPPPPLPEGEAQGSSAWRPVASAFRGLSVVLLKNIALFFNKLE